MAPNLLPRRTINELQTGPSPFCCRLSHQFNFAEHRRLACSLKGLSTGYKTGLGRFLSWALTSILPPIITSSPILVAISRFSPAEWEFSDLSVTGNFYEFGRPILIMYLINEWLRVDFVQWVTCDCIRISKRAHRWGSALNFLLLSVNLAQNPFSCILKFFQWQVTSVSSTDRFDLYLINEWLRVDFV